VWKWRQGKGGETESTRAVSQQEVPTTADEFLSADELDNDVEPDDMGVAAMEVALERLREQHLAFRRPDKCEECDLDRLRLEILTAVTASSDLEDYYAEAWQGKTPDPAVKTNVPANAYRRIAVMQLELMTRAFYVLQLHLFANAPENRGWMTLFRSWGMSPRFNRVFDELASTLSPEFTKFYRVYIRYLPPRASAHARLPIHHPWLKPSGARGRGLYMDSGLVEAEIELEVRPGAGGVLDPRGREGADQTFEKPSDAEPSSGGQGPAPNE